MNWTKASAIAEIVSSGAIVLTLVYLAIQTSQLSEQTEQNTAAVIASVRQQSLDTEVSMLLKMADYAEEKPVPGLSTAQAREILFGGVALRIREMQWLQLQDGLLDGATWETYMVVLLKGLSEEPAFRAYWEESLRDGVFAQGFVDEVNEALADSERAQNEQ